MLNKAILDPEVSGFIKKNLKKDLPALILKGSPFEKVTIQEIAVQIKGMQVAEKKFPHFFENSEILYPPKLNLEQTSSEITASYKAALVKGKSGIDLTGGLGIDSYFLSRNFEDFTYCELNADLAEIAAHNFTALKADNLSVYAGNGLALLEKTDNQYNLIYSDPARRDDRGGKVFKFEDCEPNIPENIDLIFSHTENLMVKSSPILDISAGINELKFVKEIHIVAVRNDVKELLWILEEGYQGEPVIETVNFEKDRIQKFLAEVTKEDEMVNFSLPENYLYEPNAAIMKSGLFDKIALKTNSKKIHQHSHLYTSEKLFDFPGRRFEIVGIKEFKPSLLKRYFKGKKANITTRNFPESVEKIRKKFKIKEGGDDYIFFTTNMNEEKIVIFCKKF
ncbi:class I SAM-dependent methyltransferase [Gramella lutea]|uniref:Class I SAM-dependent methyltransferase n=1 Tax=Christiangramia lutea TaxID=1607951 RepID=A0A9X2AAG7_9FLAO|nr:class I SAM-dependent methyltransferase [Christiangramia lutea]MCH4823166.1 class I SAM-dependent methyltransferase [Christiangramia lutea]